MTLSIDLLGSPRVVVDGEPRPRPRGTKTWALLAVLALSDTPVPRERLAGLLFSEAADPLAALRWTASELRRLLGAPESVNGDPLALVPPTGTRIDVDLVLRGERDEAMGLPGLGRPLLEGVNPDAGAAFELWVEGERRRVEAATEAVLHEAASACLAHDQAARAVELSQRLVNMNPLDENFHVLLVRSLVAAGDQAGAEAHVDTATRLLVEELGIGPGPGLAMAVRVPERVVGAGVATLRAQLEAGEAALGAGVVDAGLATLRGVVAGVADTGDAALAAEAQLALGIGLVHAARGTDEEAVAILQRTLDAADRADRPSIGAAARRELGYVEFLRARYGRAQAWLEQGRRLAGDDDAELAWIELFDGSCWSDQGHYARGEASLRSSRERAEGAGERRAAIFAATHLGRLLLLLGDLDEAGALLDDAAESARQEAWTAFIPYPEAYAAEVRLLRGEVDQAEALLEHAHALGCQVGDVCWQTMTLRGLGLVAERRGDVEGALERLAQAPSRCRSLPDTYRWAEAYAQESLAAVAVRHGDARAPAWVDELDEMASRHNLRELAVRAKLHRGALGQGDAVAVAALLAADVDNPSLQALVVEAVPAG